MLEFDWTENKRHKTIVERGIDFAYVARIWDDPFFKKEWIPANITEKFAIKQ